MTKNSHNIQNILQTLRDGNMTEEQTSILTYIRSNFGKAKLLNTIGKTQYVELCQLLLGLVSIPNKNEKNMDTKRKNVEAEITLYSVLKNFDHKINIFEMISHIDRKERLRALKFLNNIEIHIFTRMILDSTSTDVINDCLQMVHPSVMKWLAASACTDNIQLVIDTETRILTQEQDYEEQLILCTLTLLHRLYEYAATNSSDFNIEPIHPVLFERVISLAYMGHKRQRAPALKVLNQALNTNLMSHIKNKHSSLWTQYKNTLQNTYCNRMSLLVRAAEYDWALQWCLSIRMLGNDLHRGAELINNLLSVEEKAFKSTDMNVRKEAFESWKHLIDNFALNSTELATSRRIKLLCIPLNAKNSKIEIVAVTKLETWWHLIVKLYSNTDKLLNQVIGQFLNFCFGPLGDTPLLSTKCDVVASPGKRFSNTKLLAFDALLQLLVQKPIDRNHIPCFIKERLSNAVPSGIFQTSYKSLFHSVGEALLMINELNEDELNNREKLIEILWSNLMMYIEQSSAEQKSDMYKELILILKEVISHITNSSLIIDLLFNIILDQLVKITHHLIYRDTTLMDLLLNLLSPEILKSADKKYLNDLTHLICHAIKPENVKVYHPNTLSFIKSVLTKMTLLIKHEVNSCVFDLWCTLAKIMTKYMEQNQQINEGTGINYNFETIQLLVIFPIQNIFWCNPGPLIKIGKLWRELYKQFNMEADLITTVKPNEILHDISTLMENSLLKDKKCYSVIAHCLDALMSTIDYESFFCENRIPPLIRILRDITIEATYDINVTAIEFSLKATSSLLITVYGLNRQYSLMCLDVLKPSIEHILEVENAVSVEKEIINTWETAVIILRGLSNLLTHEFIMSIQKTILLALRHNNCEIAAQAMSLISIKNDLNEEVQALFKEIEKMAQKSPDNKTNSIQKNNDSQKHVKIAGSFLNRIISSPRTVGAIKKDCDAQKMRVPSPLPQPEPDTQDYIVIKNDVKLDINRLTEHQKESLKRHRDDIPAMYNDLSQSASRNTQEFEDWFKNKSEVKMDDEKNVNESTQDKILMDGEANKENDVGSCIHAVDNTDETFNDSTTRKKLNVDKSNAIIETNEMEHNNVGKNDTNTQISTFVDDGNNLIDEKTDMEAGNIPVPPIIPKKLNFYSCEEFSDEKDNADSIAHCSIRLSVGECDKQRTQYTAPHINMPTSLSISGVKPNDYVESQSLESLYSMRRRRPRGTAVKVGEKSFRCTRLSNTCDDQSEQNLKRKTSLDDDSEKVLANKRRRCTEIPQLSSDTTSDTENINLIDSENHSVILPNEELPKRTKKEMSRLQINMVFNRTMPSKLRSKPTDDFVYGSKTKRQKNIKYSTKSTSQNAGSQELVKKRRKRKTHSLPAVEIESSTTVQIESLESDNVNPRIKANNEIERNDETFSNTVESAEALKMNEDSNSKENAQIIHRYNNTKTLNPNDSANNSPKADSSCDIVRIEDEEEVIENSQDNNLLLRSTHQESEERCHSITFLTKMSPKKEILHEHVSARKLPHEQANKTITADVNLSSPKSIKRLSRTKIFTSQGRAAHMLGLVTKLAIGEKDKPIDNIKYSDDELNKKLKSPKELESDGTLIKKERTLILKEPDRIGSPSGSRQEKIFNNMKSKEYTSSPPSNLFSNLKNDGEKVSPKFEKIKLIDSIKTSNKDYSIESSMPLESDELPMLEWSNANQPSLTASPSASILKRQRQMISDIDNEITPSKRKRVSFADPPVSREMGYEVISGLSPIKTNKLGQSRASHVRKDTPIKIKQSKFRIIQIDAENSDQLLSNKLNKSTPTDRITIDHMENNLLTKNADDFKGNFEDCDVIQTNATNFRDNETCKTFDETGHIHNSSVAPTMAADNAEAVNNVQVINKIEIVEMRRNSPTTKDEVVLKTHDATYQTILHKEKNNCNYNDSIVNKPEELFIPQIKDSSASSKLNITDDPTIAQILNGSDDSYKWNELEDTVDIQNVSNFNSTTNSDELFYGKLGRTSTQIAAMTAIAQNDTLPVTDSMFLSQVMSQDSLTTQKSITLSQPHTMDITNPVCPILLGCKEPIDAIVNDLVNPLWAKSLSKYFAARNINTIGDLAQLSEREVARFPVKSSPKANYIKQVLNNFSVSYLSSLESETAKTTLVTTSNAVCSTPRANEKNTKIVNEIFELNSKNYDLDDNNDTSDITATSLSSVHQSLTDDEITEQDIEIATEPLMKITESENSNDYGSIILDTSISPPSKNSMTLSHTGKLGISLSAIVESSSIIPTDRNISMFTTKSEGVQLNIQKVLDEIDPHLLLQSAMKRNTPEHILAQYKMKMNHKSEADFTKESLRLLGLEIYTETGLKNACHDYGVTKVLGRLPGIFNADNQFFSKVLSTYRMKITADDCISALNLNEIKKALCKKCSSSELCEMLSTVLTNEEKDGVNTPITEVASLNAMLKRMPLDTIISHTVANDELIPSSFVLEIALQNNNPETITHALDAQFPDIVENIIERNMSEDRIITYIDKRPLSKDKLLDIYRAVCDKLSPGQLLDVHNEIMKKKLGCLDINESK